MLRLLASTPVVWIAASMSVIPLVFLVVRPELGFFIAPIVAAGLPIFTTYRASPFEASLPVDARRISTARIGMALVLVWLPIVAWMVAGHVRGTPAPPPMSTPSRDWELVVLAAATVLTLLPHAIRPGVLGVPHSRLLLGPYATVAVVCGIGFALIPPLLLAAFLTLAAVITFAYIWHATPASFQLAPVRAPGPAPRPDAPTPLARTENDVPWWRPIARSVFPLRTLGVAAMVGFMGFSDMWLFYFVMFTIGDAAFARCRNQWMRTLPIPRRALLWITLVPFLFPLLGVLLIGKLTVAQIPPLYADLNSIGDGAPHAFSRAPDLDRHTKVALAFWKAAPAERPPVIQAPWGETSEAETMSVLGRPYYNPYSARKHNSEEFREWQFGRATAAVYGRPLSRAEYDADDFVPPHHVTASLRVYILGGALALTLALFMAWALEFINWHRLGRHPVLQTAIGATLWVLGFVLIMGVDLYYLIRHGSVVLIPLTTAWVMTLADRLASMPSVLVAAVLPVMAMYGVLEWQFNRSESGSEWWIRRQ